MDGSNGDLPPEPSFVQPPYFPTLGGLVDFVEDQIRHFRYIQGSAPLAARQVLVRSAPHTLEYWELAGDRVRLRVWEGWGPRPADPEYVLDAVQKVG